MSQESKQPRLIIRQFHSLQDYTERFEAMKNFTAQRDAETPDELWLLQHPSVLTQGQAGKPEHILIPSNIPIVQSDRGGQVTWHGEGQLIAYLLFDLNRLKWHVRDLVNFAENMMLWILKQYQIQAYTKADAPGVYVDGRKIGSLGFKIRRGRSYHGLSLNIDCSLDGFHTINPCGYAGLEMNKKYFQTLIGKINKMLAFFKKSLRVITLNIKINDRNKDSGVITTKNVKPTLQHAYVALMMDVIGRGLVMANQVDPEIRTEISGFPVGLSFSMKVFPHGSQFVVKVQDDHSLVLIKNPTQKPDLTITFKHVTHAFLVFSFQESTAQAFANDRMIADGDLSYAIRLVRCLNRMEALILPKIIANLAVKAYPQDLTLKEKLSEAANIYLKVAQSYFKRSA
ncbi:hypothetical protein GWI33_010823 [Rhynchophorus ferrugineus]|uniref:lipoyl(octanoyl) transferase n=1 Tax=Rhynchophorus ferrugineus TaxID=354439 RepID=A0A834IDQ8_RHYFE|nr:hypothetical protein GWI33_010823 [Rhynchophorus ferrugineus]